jgi:predicted adenine nucleotide alpha hydrolase (AANH) superfamily ATPase
MESIQDKEIAVSNLKPELQEFLNRRESNKVTLNDRGYTLIDKGYAGRKAIVKLDEDANVIGSPCSYCFSDCNKSSFSYGAYVGSTCPLCFPLLEEIELFLINPEGKQMRKGRVSKQDPETVKIDWDLFEKQASNKQAKLVDMANTYKLYPDEMKAKIKEKYKDRVTFKKGRGGGIFLAP